MKQNILTALAIILIIITPILYAYFFHIKLGYGITTSVFIGIAFDVVGVVIAIKLSKWLKKN